ncbi:MAG: hypothetical protein BroJett024_27070 [Alphaproteobacteria bacterium]|nr:MAG: hypothetical protein BroJett024_27070 [Alphaproteobacteria bacterium]
MAGLAGTALAGAVVLLVTGCASPGPAPIAATPPPPPEIPSRIKAAEIAGRWGLAAYHKPEDRPRTEAAARNQCRQPYVISLGPNGGVMMHLADSSKIEELRMKGAPGDRTFIGPAGEAGGPQDREIVSFDGRVMITRFVDKEVESRYGTSVYVRCAPRA